MSLSIWNVLYVTGPAQGCGGLLNASSGTIGSVDSNQDNRYEPNLVCVWQIIVPDDRVIKLHFNQFMLDSHTNCLDGDYLKVDR
jgi:cubilin